MDLLYNILMILAEYGKRVRLSTAGQGLGSLVEKTRARGLRAVAADGVYVVAQAGKLAVDFL